MCCPKCRADLQVWRDS